jgi:riboflavin synthase
MFTGLVEAQGQFFKKITQKEGLRLIIQSPFTDLTSGESIAVNGVCLTVLPIAEEGHLQFDVSPETLKLTNLGELTVDAPVNLERAMLAGNRFGGHYVTGHVDTTAVLNSIQPMGEYIQIDIGGFKVSDMRYLLAKGSIALDGVSLTINQVNHQSIQIMLVPHTLLHTAFGKAELGRRLNVEFDYIARIVAHQLGSQLDSTILSPFEKYVEGSV